MTSCACWSPWRSRCLGRGSSVRGLLETKLVRKNGRGKSSGWPLRQESETEGREAHADCSAVMGSSEGLSEVLKGM